MNKALKVMLAVLGGIDVTFNIFTPILIVVLWVTFGDLNSFSSTIYYSIGFLATLFRAIKVGFFKK